MGNNTTKLKSLLALTFNRITYDEDLLLEIIEEANHQRKGTMIVISDKAKDEAARLQSSSINIQPIQFSKHQLKLVTGIDGALIIDTTGYCHAIGAILDGSITENGDPSRGARFNSAVRYVNLQRDIGIPCLVAVVSEDKYIDILSSKVNTAYYG